MSLSPEVTLERRKGISATDAAPIMGISPWKSAADVWLEKKKPELIERKESKAIYWGTRLEQTVAEEYTKETGQDLEPSRLLHNKKIPWMMCSPDRIIKGKKKGLECKTAGERMAYQWGPSGSDRVPQYYLIQCFHSMMVTNFYEWDLAVLIGGQDFRIYHLFRDMELMKVMFDHEKEFHDRFIAGNETPQFDWGKSVAEFVRRKYPRHAEGEELDVDANGDDVLKKALLDLIQARGSQATAKKIRETQESLIKSYMRTSEVLEWKEKGIRATWRNTKDSIKIDWRAVFEEMVPYLQISADEKERILLKHTEQKEGSRRFVFKDSEGDDDDE